MIEKNKRRQAQQACLMANQMMREPLKAPPQKKAKKARQ